MAIVRESAECVVYVLQPFARVMIIYWTMCITLYGTLLEQTVWRVVLYVWRVCVSVCGGEIFSSAHSGQRFIPVTHDTACRHQQQDTGEYGEATGKCAGGHGARGAQANTVRCRAAAYDGRCGYTFGQLLQVTIVEVFSGCDHKYRVMMQRKSSVLIV